MTLLSQSTEAAWKMDKFLKPGDKLIWWHIMPLPPSLPSPSPSSPHHHHYTVMASPDLASSWLLLSILTRAQAAKPMPSTSRAIIIPQRRGRARDFLLPSSPPTRFSWTEEFLAWMWIDDFDYVNSSTVCQNNCQHVIAIISIINTFHLRTVQTPVTRRRMRSKPSPTEAIVKVASPKSTWFQIY